MHQRFHIIIQGRVQGVGFRAFVHRLATEMSLSGWVVNHGDGVELEVEGVASQLALFAQRLRSDAPPISRIADIDQRVVPSCGDAKPFAILRSLP